MNLIALTNGHASPGLVRSLLLPRFNAVDVEEATMDGWFDMKCWSGWGEDARLRLRLRFRWNEPFGWTYSIRPGERA